MSLAGEPVEIDHAKRVGHVQRHIGALAVFGNRDAARVDGFRLVIGPAIRRWIGKVHALPVGQEARLRVHIGYDDVVVVLAEVERPAVGGIGDAGERPRLAGCGCRALHKGRDEALDNLSGGGVEHDNRLGRAHEQDGAAIGLAVRIQRDGFGAHGRAEIDDFAGGRQRLVVRDNNRPIVLRANGAIRVAGLRVLIAMRVARLIDEARDACGMAANEFEEEIREALEDALRPEQIEALTASAEKQSKKRARKAAKRKARQSSNADTAGR